MPPSTGIFSSLDSRTELETRDRWISEENLKLDPRRYGLDFWRVLGKRISQHSEPDVY